METGAGGLRFRDRMKNPLTGREFGHCSSSDALPMHIICIVYNIVTLAYNILT